MTASIPSPARSGLASLLCGHARLAPGPGSGVAGCGRLTRRGRSPRLSRPNAARPAGPSPSALPIFSPSQTKAVPDKTRSRTRRLRRRAEASLWLAFVLAP